MTGLSFRRFVRVDDREDDDVVELARSGSAIFVQTSRRGGPPRVDKRQLSSPETAQRSLDRRVAALLRDGYDEDGVVERPEPEASTQEERAEARGALLEEGRRRFYEALPAFVSGWQALGHSPCLTFQEQCRGHRGRHPREVARQCLQLVASTFGVHFTERTTTYDDEHGRRSGIRASGFAEFYGSPANVLVIAYAKLRGRCASDDDADVPGLADELLPQLRQLAGE